MRAWILLAAGALNLLSCSESRISPQEATTQAQAPPVRSAPEGIVYLLRRVAAATEDRLQGFPAGTQARVIEDRSGKLLVEIEGMQFEISRQEATDDLDQRDRVLARSTERQTVRLIRATSLVEDREFLLEENARRRTFADAKIERLRSAILSAREEIAKQEAEYDDAAGNKSRQDRITALQTDIANFDREIQILSDSVAGED
jgi:hypothetical protein